MEIVGHLLARELQDDRGPSFEAITAFGPLLTIVAEIGRPSVFDMSWARIPWFARLTMTRTTLAQAELARELEELGAVAQGADPGRTTRKISFETASIAIVRSS